MKCANHPDRTALGYCSACGKALCTACLVRTSTGNYCEPCATGANRPARTRRAIPWWAIALGVLLVLILLRAFVR
jgi:hypothetical protein